MRSSIRFSVILSCFLLSVNFSFSQNISGGGVHSLLLCSDSTVKAFGENYSKQLADSFINYITTPIVINGLSSVIAVSSGYQFSMALKSDGTVWTWGDNYYGQLGDGTSNNHIQPAQAIGLPFIVAISAGQYHSLALDNSGNVWAWGNNYEGELGNNSTAGSLIPVQVTGLTGVTAISAGDSHSMALLGGNVWMWGYNGYGQLGKNNTANDSVPAVIVGLSNITAIDAGGNHSIALKNDGTVWCWGANSYGQLGDGTTTMDSVPQMIPSFGNIIAINAGGDISAAIKNDNTVWMWGFDMDPPQRLNQVNVGMNSITTPVQIAGFSGITKISCGSNHLMAYKSDGTFWGYGEGGYGQLGNGGSNFTYLTPQQVVCPCGSTITPTVNAGADVTICPYTNEPVAALASGLAPFQYLWENATYFSSRVDTISPLLNILSSGQYTVSVVARDMNLCPSVPDSLVATVLVPPATPTILAGPFPTVCNGNSVTLTAMGTDVSFYWLPGGSTTTSITVTPTVATTYTLVTTDAAGCTSFTTQLVDLVLPNLTKYDISCAGGPCSGSATASPVGGAGGYTYAWSVPGTNNNIYSLCVGGYTVTVTDLNGCAATDSANIVDPGVLTMPPITHTNVSCNGLYDGKIIAQPTGGITPYTYVLDPGGYYYYADTISGWNAGSYTVTVTDAGGCAPVVDSAIITEPSVLSVSITGKSNVSCNGGNNGSINTNTGGGTLPYAYSWMPSAQTTSNATGLTAGIYTITVTDSSGCTAIALDTISEPQALTSTISSNNVTCNGGNNGAATTNPTGGTTPYTFLWNPSAQTTQTANSLTAVNHTLTITDANGCVSTSTVSISEPAPLLANISQTNISCNGMCDGSAVSAPSGGTAPYSYMWNPGGAGSSEINLCPGTYSLTVFDMNGCATNDFAVITQPGVLTVTLSATPTNCNNTGTGTATATANGGTLPYTYLWTPVMQNTQIATGLFIGNYSVAIVDNNGCMTGDTISVNGPLPIPITATATPTSCGNQNGTASVNISGPGSVPPFYILWTTGDTGTAISALDANIYRANVTDGNGCFSFADAFVTSSNGPAVTINSVVPVSCFGGNNGAIDISVSGGTPPYIFEWSDGQTTEDASNLYFGPYEVSVYDATGCVVVKSIFVNQPNMLSLTPSSISSGCAATNGTAMITANGGNAPYNYAWSSGGTTSAETGLGAGVYQVIITDTKGCSDSMLVAVQDSGGPLVFVDTIVAANCGSSGYVLLVPQDSAAISGYQWNTGSTTQNLTNVNPGNYGVVVTDTSGCKSVLIAPVNPVLPPLKPLCVVTVDTITNENIVVWEKPISTFIAGFNIYRETSTPNIYQKIAYWPYSNVSTYYDPIADPDMRWSRYRISEVDICGAEGPLSPEHKTIHLSIQSSTADSTNLIWDAYTGYPFTKYYIYRKDSASGYWNLIDSVASTQTTYLDTLFPFTGDTIRYHVDVQHPGGDCNATLKNPELMATSVKSSKSNQSERLTNNPVLVAENNSDDLISIYPNPSHGTFMISNSSPELAHINLYNSLGELIYQMQSSGAKTQIALPGIAKGIYHLEIRSSDNVINKKIIIN